MDVVSSQTVVVTDNVWSAVSKLEPGEGDVSNLISSDRFIYAPQILHTCFHIAIWFPVHDFKLGMLLRRTINLIPMHGANSKPLRYSANCINWGIALLVQFLQNYSIILFLTSIGICCARSNHNFVLNKNIRHIRAQRSLQRTYHIFHS